MHATSLLIRGSADDCEAALRVIHSAFSKYRGWLNPESSAFRETVETLREKLLDHTLLLAKSGKRIVACLLHVPVNGDLYFYRLAVLPAYQRRGVGKQLINCVEREAKISGCKRVTLQVRIALKNNIQYFQSLGYHISASGSHDGFIEPTWYEMAKVITS